MLLVLRIIGYPMSTCMLRSLYSSYGESIFDHFRGESAKILYWQKRKCEVVPSFSSMAAQSPACRRFTTRHSYTSLPCTSTIADAHESQIPSMELVSVLKNLHDASSGVSDMLTEYRTENKRISGAAGFRTVLLKVDSKMAGYASMIEEAHRFASDAHETMTGLVEPLQQEVSDLRSRFEVLDEEDLAHIERPDLINRLRSNEKQLELIDTDSSRLAALLKASEGERKQAGVRASGLRMQLDVFKGKKEEADELNSDLHSKVTAAEEKMKEASERISNPQRELTEAKAKGEEARYGKRNAESRASKAQAALEALRMQIGSKAVEMMSLANLEDLNGLERRSREEDGSVHEYDDHALDQDSLLGRTQAEAYDKSVRLGSGQRSFPLHRDLDEEDGRTGRKRRLCRRPGADAAAQALDGARDYFIGC